MSSRKSKTPKRRKSSSKSQLLKDRQRFKVLLAALFVTGFLILCLVVLAHLRSTLQTAPTIPVTPSPEVVDTVDPAALMSEIQLEIDSTLWRAGVPFDRLSIVTREQTVHYEIRATRPSPEVFKDLSRRIMTLSPTFELLVPADGGPIAVRHKEKTLFLIHFFDGDEKILPKVPKPRLAIIIDDLGANMPSARALLAIDLPLTFAVMPDLEYSRQVAELANSQNREVMLHIPMEPRDYPKHNPGDNALFDNLAAPELRKRLLGYLQQIPHVSGGNNHMGSRFTENGPGMAAVLAVLHEKQLFFVDSRTSNRSVAAAEAKVVRIPFGARDVFLDNVREVEVIRKEIRKLAGLARRKGEAIGICHPYPQTIEALAKEAEMLRSQGIEVVPASKLVR